MIGVPRTGTATAINGHDKPPYSIVNAPKIAAPEISQPTTTTHKVKIACGLKRQNRCHIVIEARSVSNKLVIPMAIHRRWRSIRSLQAREHPIE